MTKQLARLRGHPASQSPVKWGDFLCTRPYIQASEPACQPGLPASHPGLPASRPASPASQPGLPASQPGLQTSSQASSQPASQDSKQTSQAYQLATQASEPARWMDGWMYVCTVIKENLLILQDFIHYQGRCPTRTKPKLEYSMKRGKGTSDHMMPLGDYPLSEPLPKNRPTIFHLQIGLVWAYLGSLFGPEGGPYGMDKVCSHKPKGADSAHIYTQNDAHANAHAHAHAHTRTCTHA